MMQNALYDNNVEQSILLRIAAGDKEAFKVIFDLYGKGVYRYCLMMIRDNDCAEDVYQETFFVFYKNIREGVQVHSLKGYLMSIARSKCLDCLNRQRRLVPLTEAPEKLSEIDSSYVDVEKHLHEAMEKIPEQYREAFFLFVIKDYSYDEIGEMLGVSHNVVRNRIYRAKQGLQKILEPLFYDNE